MIRGATTPGRGRRDHGPTCGVPTTQAVGVPIVVTLVDAPACHLCEDAKSTLSALAQSYPMTVQVVSIGSETGHALMQQHRAPMSPLVLLDEQYFSSGRLPRRKLERRLAQALRGEADE